MQLLAGYTVLGRLGSGTSGTVWKARDDALGRVVAIKALDAPSAAARAQWRSEAAVLAALDDPHLVAVYGYAENDQGAFIIEEWIDGVPLAGVLAAGPLSTAQALGVIRGALLGLAHVHARALVHGDISPGNILLDTQGTSKLVDFGLSTATGAPSSSSGTAAYASPETQRGQAVSAASDVYAAAAVLAYLLRGRAAASPDLDGVDPALHPVLRRALDPDPARRYPDAGAFLAALETDAGRRYGPTWWTQTGMAALVGAAPAVLLIEGTGATAAVAGHGALAPATNAPTTAAHELTEHLTTPPPPHALTATPAGPGPDSAPPAPAPPHDRGAERRAPRPRSLRAPLIAASTAALAIAAVVVAYAATRPSHTVQGSPVAIGTTAPVSPPAPSAAPSTPSSASSAPTTAASGVPSGAAITGTWKGTYVSSVFSGATGGFTVLFTVTNSNLITGRIIIGNACIHDGTITGTIAGQDLGFGKVRSANDVGDVSFHGTVSGDHMSGEYATDAACGNDRGTWEASRS